MSSPLPSWIERLLGIESGPGEGTVWSLDHTWPLPPWLTVLLVVFAVSFIVVIYALENPRASIFLRLGLAAVRIALVAVVLFMIAHVSLSLERTGLPYVAVLVDDSLSMTIVDQYDDQTQADILERLETDGQPELSRWNLAEHLLTERDGELLDSIREDYKLRVYFLTGPRASQGNETAGLVEEVSTSEPAGEATRLGTGVRAVLDDLRGTTPAAIVVLSDGINTDGPGLVEATAYARRKGVPLYMVGLGDDRPVRDLRLTDLLVEEVVFVDDIVNFEVKLTGTGFQGRQVRVVLRRLDRSGVLAEANVTVGPDGQSQQVVVQHRPTEEGEFRYVVEVEPLEDEQQTANNRLERLVRVRKEKIRVLLVEAYPNFEFRYLRHMLLRDTTIELSTFLQEADLEHAEQATGALRGFPVRRDELFEYDVIILGDVDPTLLTATMMQNLVDFVEEPGKGGALILIAGPKYMPLAYRDTPLAPLMPIDLDSVRYPDPDQPLAEGFSVRPTEMGETRPQMQLGNAPAETRQIWENLPPLYWMIEAPEPKKTAHVLAARRDHQGRLLPIICMHYVGAGKVLFHATDETWRWRYRVGDVFFARYWVQTIRYLCRSKLAGGGRSAELTSDRREYRRGEPVVLRVRFEDERLAPSERDGVTVILEHPGHKTRQIKLHRSGGNRGLFEGRLTSLPIGSYHARVAIPTFEGRAPAVDFTVMAPPGEFERVQMDAVQMRRAAELSGGRYYTFLTADRLADQLPAGRQVPVESLPPVPLWNQWPLLLFFLVLLVAEWLLRKSGGMV